MKWNETESEKRQTAMFDVMLDKAVPVMDPRRQADPIVRVVSVDDRLAEMERQIQEMEGGD
jgi:hypothetical protein